ncbi:hypothetical protein [Methanobacterium ferruginis]|jgi:hypothetical protein|uniref:hypothetical protein n=1 Tax=Methanobacterium ferruginis TaxID=710191 RepID=UPI0025739183|nr:hypothetical protein [Methanobacterium ferruginis]MCC7549985.1 hypothetical protein [Methanobacterium sp.]BDZ68189.1 hypothetical protein GCM10025860_16370 [Methanobacterium ferruginis]
MTPKKSGTLFIVLMIALVAYGTASGANALNIGTDIGVGLIPSNFNLNGDQKISEIGDSDFTPIHIVRHIQVNTTNTTNTSNTTNNTTTPTTPTNNTN